MLDAFVEIRLNPVFLVRSSLVLPRPAHKHKEIAHPKKITSEYGRK